MATPTPRRVPHGGWDASSTRRNVVPRLQLPHAEPGRQRSRVPSAVLAHDDQRRARADLVADADEHVDDLAVDR